MMLADLIDGDDFRQRLQALGVRIPDGACPETCARMAACKYNEVGVEGLPEAIHDMMQHSDEMLPSVRQAIDTHLLPRLRANE